jgi:hypothetical protein
MHKAPRVVTAFDPPPVVALPYSPPVRRTVF